MKRNDIILLLCILGVAALLFLVGQVGKKEDVGTTVVVTVKGTEYGRYTLRENRRVEIIGPMGTNYLRIEDGIAWMEEAVCPDRYCIKQGKVSKGGQQIICLPNGIVVELVGGDEEGLDAVVQ